MLVGAVTTVEAQNAPKDSIRTVQTCILNDDIHPVEDSLILTYAKESFKSFEDNVGIKFERSRKMIKNFPDEAFPRANTDNRSDLVDDKTAIYLNSFCPDETEIIIIFSNYKHPGVKGWADDKQGVIVIFYTNREKTDAPRWDKSDNPTTVTLLKHELAHLFVEGKAHTKDRNSFMYDTSLENSVSSYGKWTEEVKRKVLKGKWRTWELDW